MPSLRAATENPAPKFKKGDRVKYIGGHPEAESFINIMNREGVVNGSRVFYDIVAEEWEYKVEFNMLFGAVETYPCYESELQPLKKKLMVYYKEDK